MSTSGPIPAHRTVIPYLIVNDGDAAIAFYTRAFGAVETVRMSRPDKSVGHAELLIGETPIMLASDSSENLRHAPEAYGGSSISLVLYVTDVDTVSERGIAAGLKTLRPVQDQFYGDRSGTFEDPFGHVWTIAQTIEDVTPQEMRRRMAAAFA